ncbi:aldo/keto reductase family oxidoreductase [Halomonas sp. SpR1]|uniref:aldo/keto reductase family oxidoreductase n=1 Tax=Halomonas sp. SpR1 TaxID=3050462 RepID=UPI0027E3B847|nr:aldo/keto reductase family oxidoreductase [Halomonas sp. SpR1]MDQ7734184.1 aldo/keto reductase family oxidoreductase [Halomonas sp. SpR1]
MNNIAQVNTFKLGDREIKRMGYGAMQLAGPGVFGPPKDKKSAIALLRAAVEQGVDHIDTSDFYGPHITNQLIREALHPYPKELTLVTKIGARRDDKGDWLPAFSKAELTQAVHDNLINLGLEQIEVVNLRAMFSVHGPAEGSISEPFSVLAELQQAGLIRHLGVSNVTDKQIEEARAIAPIVCVQNHYNLANRNDDPIIEQLAQDEIAYVPFFPLGGFTPLQSTILQQEAKSLQASPLQVALAWLLQRSPNILLIPGTSSVAHLQENLAATQLVLPEESVRNLNRIASEA